MRALDNFCGQSVLLVYWGPQCGFCDLIAPHLVQLHRQHGNSGLALVMIGRGDPQKNRRNVEAYGFAF